MDNPGPPVALAEKHRALTLKSANAAKSGSRLLYKRLWLARYVNDPAERLDRPEPTITPADIPALEDLAEEPTWANPPKSLKTSSEAFGGDD